MRLWHVVLVGLVPIALNACAYGLDRNAGFDRHSVIAPGDQPFVDIAWAEFVRRGGSMPRESTTVRVQRSGGSVFVEFEFLPRAPGGHFEVTIQESSRRVVGFERGL